MPTCTRLLLTLRASEHERTSGASDDTDTHVYDTVSTRREVSTAAAVRSALLGCGAHSFPQELRDALAEQLAVVSAASAATGREVGSVELGHGLRLDEARAYGEAAWAPVVEGAATFHVCDQALGSRVRGLRAAAELDGQTLELVALVHSSSKPEEGRPALHFVGPPGGELKDLRSLALGKRSNSQVRAGPASHFLRRGWQLNAHSAAMRDVYCEVDPTTTKREHTLLLDAYVSQVELGGRALRCVTLFV